MKPNHESVFNAVTYDYHNTVGTVVHAEWQMNRFFNTLVDNTPSEGLEGYDPEYFPIESITENPRPTRGIAKAVVGSSVIEGSRAADVPDVRFYVADADDEYQYWQSPVRTNASGVFPLFTAANFPAEPGETYAYDNLTCVRPTVSYINEDTVNASGDFVDGTPRTVKANKISFTVENTYSYPTDYDVQVKYTTAGAWTTVASNLPIDPQTGKLMLWWNGTAWTRNMVLTQQTNLHAVRLVVRKMYVPPASRTVSVSTKAGRAELTDQGTTYASKEIYAVSRNEPSFPGGGIFTKADVGSKVTGSGIAANTRIKSVKMKQTLKNNYKMVGGKKIRLEPTVTYHSIATLDKPATGTSSSANVTVTGSPVGVFFNLIELGASLEFDLTPDVTNWEDGFNMGEADFITPLGNISSNTGSITLWNGDDGRFRNNNPASPLYGLLDKGVQLRCWMKYGSDLVQEFEMFSETWNETDESTTVNLVDNSVFFMSVKPRPVLYQDVPVQEAIWRICDIVGFTNYEVTPVDKDAIIDIFWTDGEKTAWELFGELSRATQTAIYFDAYGTLQIKTRNTAWDKTKEASYDLLEKTVKGGQPANIISLSESSDYEANKVTVNFQQTGFSESRDNIIPFEVVWEPEGDVVLRATEIAKDLLKADKVVRLATKEAITWPWTGIMNIEGEFISYDAKQYSHYLADGARKYTWVKDLEEQKRLDEDAGAFHRHLNSYTGAFRVEERGLWGTEVKDHKIDLTGWTRTRRRNHASNYTPSAGIMHNKSSSTVTLTGKKEFDMADFTYLHRGSSNDAGYRYLGVRMKIDNTSHIDKSGGIFFAADDGIGSGYFLDVVATSKMSGKGRSYRNEVLFYSKNLNGSAKAIGGETISVPDKSKNHKKGATIQKDMGARFAVPANRYIDFDIWHDPATHHVQIFGNGVLIIDEIIPAGWRRTNVGRTGMFARGASSITFDYFYAIGGSPGTDLIDSESYFDRIRKGYYSTQASDWTFDTKSVKKKVKRTKWKKKKKGKKYKWVKYDKKYKQRVFEEFGPVAHEVREFDIKYTTDKPVLESKIYLSNDSQAVCTEYTGGISGAMFTVVNTSRENAVIKGEDERTSMGNGQINHHLFVYGRPVIQQDAQKVEKEDAWALRRRGPIEVEYSSPWIQNRAEAERFGEWLTTHWSRSDSTLEVEIFGNPLLELTDVVKVNYKHINSEFYVIGISNSFDAGLTTTLTLRKVRDV